MATIDKLINNIQNNVQGKAHVIVGDIMQSQSPELVSAQQKQMLTGRNSEGSLIGKYKNKYYRRKKFNMNVLAGYGNVDLKLTGEFHRGIKTYFFDRSFFFTSTDWKMKKLTDDYGENIFGLNSKSRSSYVREHLKPAGVDAFKSKILKT